MTPRGPSESFKHSEEAPSPCIYCYINSLLRKHKIWINLFRSRVLVLRQLLFFFGLVVHPHHRVV